tara:strand:- start:110 stop:859 length:750 start_codon:yes stop_codon:yes gene_type:complete
MLLRRITKHVVDQNWVAVGIDMLVVILGIYIGFQLNNWNVERQNAKKGKNYLERIADELEQDIRFFDGVLNSNNRSIENAQFLLETLDKEDLVREDPTRFITSVASVGASIVVNVSNNTFEEIKFSGNLELIADEELRNQIADYYDFIEVSQTFSHLRFNAETEYQNRYAGTLAPDQFNQFVRDVSYSEVDALLVYERFTQTPDLIEWLPIIINAKRGTIAFSTRSQQNAKDLLDKIRGKAILAEEPSN